MSNRRTMPVTACVSIALVFLVCGNAAGFNPQPEPPGVPSPEMWSVEGFIDMWAMSTTQADTLMPFGISPAIVGDAVVDFSVGVVAQFNAPATADKKPVNGLYDVEFEYLFVRIGNTTWDQTMPGTLQFNVVDGVVNGCSGGITLTMPSHPDLSFALPASPGTWEANDDRDGDYIGRVAGTYSLRDGVVPEPATACLLALGGLALIRRRR